MELIDTHCHLDFSVFDSDRDVLMARAKARGVSQIIVPAVSRDNWKHVQRIGQQYDSAKVAYGLHPMFMKQHRSTDINDLRKQIEQDRPVAVGECGLDFYIDEPDKNRQIVLFIKQLEIAQEYALPVIIHARKSLDIILKYLRKYNEVKGVIHSFSGSLQQAELCIKQGFMLGFGGPVTYTRASKLRKLVADLPLECLLLETDAPDQPDSMHQGQRNEPANLLYIAEVIAELRGIKLEDVAQQTTRNAEKLFGIHL